MANQTFNPSNAIVSIENLLRLCDEIWYQCGDQSTDVIILFIFQSSLLTITQLLFSNLVQLVY